MAQTEIATTRSGGFRVFHKSQAGAPEFFTDEGGDWYFEPNDPHGGDDVYSVGYPTREAALAAAEAREDEQDLQDAIMEEV